MCRAVPCALGVGVGLGQPCKGRLGTAAGTTATKLEPAETELSSATTRQQAARLPQAHAAAPLVSPRQPVSSGEPPHASPIACPVPSRMLEQSVAPPHHSVMSLCASQDSPKEHRTSGEPQQPHGRCREMGDRGEEEGWGLEDLWVARVRFTRRKGNRGMDRVKEPASPSPCLRAAARRCLEPTFRLPTLPSTTEGARVPRHACLPPPRLQRLPLLPQSSFSSTEGT